MIKFLLKGLIRDRSRSLFPTLVVVAGVAITVILYAWIQGVADEFIRTNASFENGHVKIMSRAYAEQADMIPNDLAYIGMDSLLTYLRSRYPNMIWAPRIKYGGLLDIPDEYGETRTQAPVIGMGLDLLSPHSHELEILPLEKAIVRGRLPENAGEILISEQLAEKLEVSIGDKATLISSTMYGEMALYNFTICGTIRFGISAMDRGALIADLADIQTALNMEDAAGEILGFFDDFLYRPEIASQIAAEFNEKFSHENDEFSPIMKTLHDQSGIPEILDYMHTFSSLILFIFMAAMSIVLWNAGLMGSLRRYGEIGVRMALGEPKGHIYRTLLAESLIIGIIGSTIGTAVGLTFAYYLQNKGIDISSMMKNASLFISNVVRARVTPKGYFIGFIPGLLATFLGAAISGIGIYKRQTSQLFKELEA